MGIELMIQIKFLHVSNDRVVDPIAKTMMELKNFETKLRLPDMHSRESAGCPLQALHPDPRLTASTTCSNRVIQAQYVHVRYRERELF